MVAGTPVSVSVVLQLAYGTGGDISREIGAVGSQVAITGPLPETGVQTAPLVVATSGSASVELVANYTIKVNPKSPKTLKSKKRKTLMRKIVY